MPYLACGCLRSHPYIFIELLKLFLYIMCPFLILPYVAFFFFFSFYNLFVCLPRSFAVAFEAGAGSAMVRKFIRAA